MKTSIKVSLAILSIALVAGLSAHLGKNNYHNKLINSINANQIKVDIKNSEDKKNLFVIEVEGMYTKSTSDIFRMKLDKIYEVAGKGDELLISIDSGGGSPTYCATDHYAVDMLKEDKGITVTTSIDRQALSCGFWLAVAGDKVYASGGAVVANIGSVMPMIQNPIHSVIEKVTGDKVEFIGTTRNKEVFAGARVEEDDKHIIQGYVDSNGGAFFSDVRDSRRGLIKDESYVFSANPIMARDAVDAGLIDGLNTLSRIKRQYVEDGFDVRYVKYQPPQEKLTFAQSLVKTFVGELTSESTLMRLRSMI